MDSIPEHNNKDYGGLNIQRINVNGRLAVDKNVKQRLLLVEWLRSVFPDLNLPANASDEDLKTCLFDGTVFCQLLYKLKKLGSANEGGDVIPISASRLEKLTRFLAAVTDMGIPKFDIKDFEKGSMNSVVECLLGIRSQFIPNDGGDKILMSSKTPKSETPRFDVSSNDPYSPMFGDERRKVLFDSKFHRTLSSPIMLSVPNQHVGLKFHEVFQIKQGRYADLPAAKISEMLKSNSLDNAPTQSLLSVVNGILDESVERKNGEIPHRVACLLRKVVQEIERRISTQAEHLRTQNNLFKTREEKFQSRIRVLEALASNFNDENQSFIGQFQQAKEAEKIKIDEKNKSSDEDMTRLMKERDVSNTEIISLKQDLERAKKTHEFRCLQVEAEAESARVMFEKKIKDLEGLLEDSSNKVQQAESARVKLEKKIKELEGLLEDSSYKVQHADSAQAKFEKRIKELEGLLEDSSNEVKQLASFSESKHQKWNAIEHKYRRGMEFQCGLVQEVRCSHETIKEEILSAKVNYEDEFHQLGLQIKSLAHAAGNYHTVLSENRKLFNELQDLKGNIRVYCRIRPFLPGQKDNKRMTIEYIGENGEVAIANPARQGKEAPKLFKFNKVYSPVSTQVEVFTEIQPLVRSVVDGYNVCIFAYGQTGSGKTYTMTGPSITSKEGWGVNYRALNDLFEISQNRSGAISYEVGVQMVEVYNEQVRDLLSNNASQKKLGILTHSQPFGLAVPDASMFPVKSTSNVIELMDIGLKNRAVGATAMNERSSRSHSIVTVHVRGTDLKTGSSLHGNLHLVDLAGSERVDRSEVTGDRLKEAQHINKSLSALGDVIFALAQKSSHVPYRNSKLTQVLQSSLGGQAKTVMFVQINPELNSYSESLSTLKFAERVSGVELGAARSSKEGRDVRELMDQVASLKDTITKRDEEIERLQLLKDLKSNVYHGITTNERRSSSTSALNNLGAQRNQKPLERKSLSLGVSEKAAGIDHDNVSDYSDVHSEADSQQSMEDMKNQNEAIRHVTADIGQNIIEDAETLAFAEEDYGERIMDIADDGLYVGTETSDHGNAETLSFNEATKPLEKVEKLRSPATAPSSRALHKHGPSGSTSVAASKEPSRLSSSSLKKPVTGLKSGRRWQ